MIPRISLSGARAAYVGPALDLAPHRNAAATLAVALAAPFDLALPADAAAETLRVALITPNTRHHLRAAGPMAFVYLDALADDHRRLRSVDLAAAQARVALAGPDAVARWGVDRLCATFDIPARRPHDPRVAAAVRAIDARPQDLTRVSAAASLAGLSPSRFQALFAEATGVPFRRYRRWRRMAAVMRAIAAGRSLTEAAHEAGFASSAHLSAAFREMFGTTPSSLRALGVRVTLDDGRAGEPDAMG